ncbi:MAG: hydrogenase maturation protein HypF [Candidatus Kentron sp. G]|nr:MAG: hydrogenase maturation protein HypF [Candidatus Kentron sp. G]VFN00304.1 MAG: hydrogenase maturation protein HypF [Candidatus Kentron sp. G]VFN01932.1 MAG: hydrogenase maturation protein HypF [Candidatus Kentron sp. G]
MKDGIQANYWVLTGRVQGVGFRPFVYRLAHRLDLVGWVQNQKGRVIILAQGSPERLSDFGAALVTDSPPLAEPRIQRSGRTRSIPCAGFSIRPSRSTRKARIYVPPDFFTCDACLAELANPNGRRYRYPFINCTQCGPRYTLMERLPYDRSNTSMAGFPLCDDCRAEYEDPLDRRFHAQPLACPVCGPGLCFYESDLDVTEIARQSTAGETQAALATCLHRLRQGEIIAIKGIGGYHLFCDARNDTAVSYLRIHKPRIHKPLAVLFPLTGAGGLGAVRAELDPGPVEAARLLAPERPIVLVRKRSQVTLSPGIAPGLGEIGAMLPYSPLHHLLLADYGEPLVATSANRSGEPVLTDLDSVCQSLGGVVQGILEHGRPIVRPADDSVFRSILGKARPIRLGRGVAPVEMQLPFSRKRPLLLPLLAVGGQMKNTVALAFGDRVVVSPHIGDMGSPRGLRVFEQVAADLQALYGVEAKIIARDAHPGYTTGRWADRQPSSVLKIHHHFAHASALSGEYPHVEPRLVFTWDGVGFGPDGTLWGGEALLGRPGEWRRAGSIRPFFLPGGERAGREPWRSAAALCWALDRDWPACPEQTGLLRAAWEKRINAPRTTAIGRLFDAAAALTGVCLEASYEGQGPMALEAACRGEAKPLVLPIDKDARGCWRIDWAPLVPFLLRDEGDVGYKAAVFHATLAEALAEQALCIRSAHDFNEVGLTGGVFQNRILTERAAQRLIEDGFRVILPERIPGNDGGLSFGQVIEAGAGEGYGEQ